MEVRLYNPDTHYDQVETFGKSWGNSYSKDQFPPDGVIIENAGAYFVYTTKSSVCWLENLIVHKDLPKDLRHQAASKLTKAAIELAKSKGFKVAYATTNNPSVITRALIVGAKAEPHQTLLTLSF